MKQLLQTNGTQGHRLANCPFGVFPSYFLFPDQKPASDRSGVIFSTSDRIGIEFGTVALNIEMHYCM